MTKQNFILNGWLVEVDRGQITRPDQAIHLEPQVMKVLAFLAKNHNEVVSKDRIISTLWGTSFVSDAVLTRCIFEIRQAFGDNPKDPQFIETIPKVGYRLIAKLDTPGRQRRTTQTALRWSIAAAVTIAAFSLFSLQSTRTETLYVNSIFVEDDLAGSFASDANIIADVLSNELRTRLTRLKDLNVSLSATESQQAKISNTKSYHLNGLMSADTSGIQYHASLISLPANKTVWAKTYQLENDNVFTLQTDLVKELAIHFDINPSPILAAHDARPITSSALALDAYHKGVAHYEKYTFVSNENAISLFEKALASDPKFGLAHARLSDALTRSNRRWGGNRLEDASTAAKKALEFEPLRPESHNAYGIVLALGGDTDQALEFFAHAYELDPSHWQSAYNAADVHKYLVQFKKAESLYLQSLEHSPQHVVAMTHLGFLYIRMGELDNAKRWLKRALDQAPLTTYTRSQLATLELTAGNTDEAIANCQKVRRFDPNHQSCLNVLGVSNLLNGNMAQAREWFDYATRTLPEHSYARLGNAQILLADGHREQGLVIVNEVLEKMHRDLAENDSGWEQYWILAACHALLGDDAGAFAWLDKAAEAGRRFYLWDAADPVFASLHGDQRFSRYVAMTRAGLP